jgi:hypothetical protein
MKTYEAPWGKTLKVVSGLLVLLVVGFMVSVWLFPEISGGWRVPWLFPVIAALCPLFMVLGYEVTEDAILIRRPFWKTRLPRAGLKSATFKPKAMSHALRTFGNGGAFSFTGWFWKKDLGAFSAYVTDPDRTVVLRFEKRTVVVSPGEPEDFVAALSE